MFCSKNNKKIDAHFIIYYILHMKVASEQFQKRQNLWNTELSWLISCEFTHANTEVRVKTDILLFINKKADYISHVPVHRQCG